MGIRAVFKCLDCGRKFTKDAGGGFNFWLLRCVKCDTAKKVNEDWESVYGKVSNEGESTIPVEKIIKLANDLRCRRCGDEMRIDLHVMCPSCHSRSNETENVLVFYD